MTQPRWRSPQSWWQYGVVLIAVVMTLVLALIFPPTFNVVPYLIFGAIIAFAASHGGLGLGLFATVLSWFAIFDLSRDTLFPLGAEPVDLLQFTVFVLVGGLFSVDRERHRQQLLFLADEKTQMQATIDSAKDFAIFSMDSDGTVISWNKGAEQLFGYTEKEILGQSASLVYTPESCADNIPEIERQHALETGATEDERWHLRKDGSRFYASGMVRPILDRSGNLRGFVKMARDITERFLLAGERVQLLEKEQEARQQAERANGLITRFMGLVVHELRSPLASIRGFATTLMEPDMSWNPGQQHQFLTIIDDEVERMTRLIDQLLDLSRLEAGSFSVVRERIDFDDLLVRAQRHIAAIAVSHTIKLNVPEDLPDVDVDADRIVQVLANLVGNAAKFSTSGSPITIGANLEDGFIRIDVTDHGIGIPTADREGIFEFYRQAENHPKEEKKGGGLGLAIAKGIIESHGGKIWVEGVQGQGEGTTIFFTIPVAASANPSSE